MSALPRKNRIGITSGRLIVVLAILAIAGTTATAMIFGYQMTGVVTDDSWFMWKAWHLHADGGLDDPLFGGFGLELFGRIWVTLLLFFYQAGGWQLAAGHALSMLCMLGASAIWYVLGAQIGLTKPQRAVLAALLVIFIPFIHAALSSRPEAFVWFLTSLAVLCFDRKRPILAGILVGVAFETHPTGLVAIAYLFAWAWRTTWPRLPFRSPLATPRLLAQLALGLVIGVLVWGALHTDFLLAPGSNPQKIAGQVNWTPFVYNYVRWAPISIVERLLVAFVSGATALVYFWRRGWQRYPFESALFISVALFLLLFPHIIPFYCLYIFPCVVLVLVRQPTSNTFLAISFTVAVLLSWTDNAAAILSRRSYTPAETQRQITAALDNDGRRVLVFEAYWFAVRTRKNLGGFREFPAILDDHKPFNLIAPSWAPTAYPEEIKRLEFVKRITIDRRNEVLIYRTRN
jgi:hypothetical protein